MIKTLTNLFKQDKEKFVVPKSVQDVIPIKAIYDDGIFSVGKDKFAKSFKFTDINYAVASREDKEGMFLEYSELLNSFDSGATTKITINNRRLNRLDFEKTILLPLVGDDLDVYREEYNKMLLDKATGANAIVQDKYITISVNKKNIEEARNYFSRVGADLISHFGRLGSRCYELETDERLRIIHDFFRVGEESSFRFDIKETRKKGHDFKDYICPDSILPEYAELYEQNSDIVGWIIIPDTKINYPVMQSPDNPNFYLKHGFDKAYSDYGCPYVSEECNVNKPSDNLIIYGHNMLRMEAYKENLPVHEDRLHVANGTLFINGKFSEEKEFCRNRLPVQYNPDAPQPVHWLRFLSELLEDEDILTLQEYLGYCLIPTTRGQTMMLLKGNGGEGKSRIGVVMQAMLGANLKNGSIAKVERSPFARADLEHELVMVDDDMKMEALKSTHYLKSLITAEMPMDLERKGEQSYQGEMYVRFLAFSNGDLESLYDHSDGFYRRQLILSVKKKPIDREDDPFLGDKLVAEVEGIFLWCLEGLRRLIANNYRFTESSRTKDNREQARRDADNVLLFLRSEGYIRLKADSTITSADLYAIYCLWCNDNAYKPLAARTVSMTLKKHADEFGLEHDNHITNSLGKQVNGFWGIEALISPGIL